MKRLLLLPLTLSFLLLCNACSLRRDPLGGPASDSLGLASSFSYSEEAKGDPSYFRTQYEAAENPAAVRNRIVFDLMNQIDEEYNANEVNLRMERATKDFAVRLVSISLTGVASQAGESVANLLAAIDTGVKGVDVAFDQAFLEERANTLIFSAMRQARAEIRAEIYRELDDDADDYPLDRAIGDVNRYYRAGFVTPALTRLAEDASVRAVTMEREARALLTGESGN